jgi:excisionase family DNA binding protein
MHICKKKAILGGRRAEKSEPAKTDMKFITITEFCSRYRISHRTVWNWVRKGRLKAVRDSGGRVLRLIDPQWPVLDESHDPDPVMRLAFLKPGQVAVLLEVLPATVRKMASQGRLKAVWLGGQRRFSLSEVRRAVAARMLGHQPKNAKETGEGIIRWARWRLEQT